MTEQKCRISKKCGGCAYLDKTYEEQLKLKEKWVRSLMKDLCNVKPAAGMKDPFYYRNKVNAAFARKKDGTVIAGMYEEGTHFVLSAENCLIEDQRASRIIKTVCRLLQDFRIRIYNEDSGFGLMRHICIRTAHETGQIMVTLVAASPILPNKNHFVRKLLELHPEITTVVLNVNERHTTMVLGKRNIVLYGKGYIEDRLCGLTYRISPNSFYQINSVQTEVLYGKAVELAGLTGKETVFDAYCGIGTIGMTAAGKASYVTGVELNKDAVRDAGSNAKRNGVKNIEFAAEDAGRFLHRMADEGKKMDVLFMDPPRSGSSLEFIDAASAMHPDKIVYISCNPETMARDLKLFKERGYHFHEVWPVDMFPWTKSLECFCLLTAEGKRIGSPSKAVNKKDKKLKKSR
ncbi:MAG: 23S rRNA (uracil(1939)-C(5))-methyltransferase RlmD [Eubacteriales bacterium]|nr:23S rRNA (uracil(1939)-C(5))-methyltransferase RlmD [Eubacteriales bacterium]